MKKYFHQIVIFIFLVIIFLPNIGLFKATDENYIKENLNRMPYQFPDINLTHLDKNIFIALEQWYGDKIDFITTFSKFWSNINYYLGISAKPEEVIIGKNGWLFGGGQVMNRVTGKDLPSQEEIILFVNGLKRMNDIAKEQNIPFVVFIAPAAAEIYSEYLPNFFSKHSNMTTLDQLAKILPKKNINFIDLRSPLILAKKSLSRENNELYMKGDPHWNYLGSYIAYEELAKNINLNYGMTLNQNPIHFIPKKTNLGNFSYILQRDDVWSNAPMPDLSNFKIKMMGRDIYGFTREMTPLEGNLNAILAVTPYENINLMSKNRNNLRRGQKVS